MRDKLIGGAHKVGAHVASALPERSLPFVGRVAGRIGGWPQRANRKMAARHQQRASGRTDRRVVDEVMECYGRYWLEMLRMPAEVRRGTISQYFDIEGFDQVVDALTRGHGAIYASPHLGGWEWAGAWMAERGHHLLAVVEAVEPPERFEWFLRQREAMGLEIAPLGPGVSTRLLAALRDNRVVALVADRDLTGDGVEVEFFGERTTLPAGPATLALRTGAALFPVCCYFGPGREHHAVVRPPLEVSRQGRLREDIARITQDLAHEFEDIIRVAPEQWHLLQPNWPSDRE